MCRHCDACRFHDPMHGSKCLQVCYSSSSLCLSLILCPTHLTWQTMPSLVLRWHDALLNWDQLILIIYLWMSWEAYSNVYITIASSLGLSSFRRIMVLPTGSSGIHLIFCQRVEWWAHLISLFYFWHCFQTPRTSWSRHFEYNINSNSTMYSWMANQLLPSEGSVITFVTDRVFPVPNGNITSWACLSGSALPLAALLCWLCRAPSHCLCSDRIGDLQNLWFACWMFLRLQMSTKVLFVVLFLCTIVTAHLFISRVCRGLARPV